MSGSLLMEIYVIYDNATECPKQKLLLGLYGELFCVDREEKTNYSKIDKGLARSQSP